MKNLWDLEDIKQVDGACERLSISHLSIPVGVTAVLGESGSGKTTLLNLLVGFESIVSGTLNSQVKENSVFWVPQNLGLWEHLTVREHISLFENDEAGEKWLKVFELDDKLESYPKTLSMGERARLSVARALTSDATILVLDEPFSHVDTVRKWDYWDALIKHIKECGKSVIFTTHSPESAMAYADNVVLLHRGKLLYTGGIQELYVNPPSEIAAMALGPVNTFSDSDAAMWLNGTSRATIVRPESITLEAVETGDIILENRTFLGSFYKVELLNKKTEERRFLFLRYLEEFIKKGDFVVTKLIVFLILSLFLFGCGKKAVELEKTPTHIEVWSMPPAGIKVPGPRSLSLNHDGSEVVVVDNAGRVLIYNPTGKLLRQWKMPDSSIGKPEGVCVLLNGNIIISDTHYYRVVIFNSVGKVLKIFGKRGDKPGEFANPVAVTQDDRGFIYTCEYGAQNRIQKFTEDGVFVKAFGKSGMGAGEFQRPSGIVWKDGLLYIADSVNHRIQVFSDDGEYKGILGDRKGHHLQFYLPYDVGLGNDNSLFVVEYGASRVTKIDLKTERILFRSGKTGFTETELTTPWGMLVDSHNRVYIADTGNKRIVRWDWNKK